MNRHHHRAGWLLGAVVFADVVTGYLMAAAEHVPAWHGVYCTVGLTTTDGCDLALHGWAYVVAAIAMILFVPLWTGVFSLVTTGLLADHIDSREP